MKNKEESCDESESVDSNINCVGIRSDVRADPVGIGVVTEGR
jgi:hypothetical protein